MWAFVFIALSFSTISVADTFKNTETGDVLQGYLTSKVVSGKTEAVTQEKGIVMINTMKWEVTADRKGRNNKVIVIVYEGPMVRQIETDALKKALVESADAGPLFILLELDTPGGRTDFARDVASAIHTVRKKCPVITYVKSEKQGGAISAGVAVALSGEKVFIAKNAVIGGATSYAVTKDGPTEFKKAYGEEIGAKFQSIWRGFLASTAEQGGRPGILAKAMVDKDIEVIEVEKHGKRNFIESVNKKPGDKVVHIWSRKGSLLTLTGEEAVACTIADKNADSRQEVLKEMNAENAEIVVNDTIQKAAAELDRIEKRLGRIKKSIDRQIKELDLGLPKPKWMKTVRQLRVNIKYLITMAKKYPDLELDLEGLEKYLNTVEANYNKAK
jgi:membrane-bound ClpP family serine protease